MAVEHHNLNNNVNVNGDQQGNHVKIETPNMISMWTQNKNLGQV